MRRFQRTTLACTLILAHVAWGLMRVPSRVVLRRFDDVEKYQHTGSAAFLLNANGLTGHDAIEWLLENTPPESVVLWSGDGMGAMEFAPNLLSPRLLVHASKHPRDQSHYGELPIAQFERQGRRGAAILVGRDGGIALEVR